MQENWDNDDAMDKEENTDNETVWDKKELFVEIGAGRHVDWC